MAFTGTIIVTFIPVSFDVTLLTLHSLRRSDVGRNMDS
jgi:hypothetical protein